MRGRRTRSYRASNSYARICGVNDLDYSCKQPSILVAQARLEHVAKSLDDNAEKSASADLPAIASRRSSSVQLSPARQRCSSLAAEVFANQQLQLFARVPEDRIGFVIRACFSADPHLQPRDSGIAATAARHHFARILRVLESGWR